MREAEVEFDEEKCGQVEVLVSPEPAVVDNPSAMHVVAYVYCEPYFFDGGAHTSRHEVPFIPQTFDDIGDDPFTEEDHAQPAEGGYPTNLFGEAL